MIYNSYGVAVVITDVEFDAFSEGNIVCHLHAIGDNWQGKRTVNELRADGGIREIYDAIKASMEGSDR